MLGRPCKRGIPRKVAPKARFCQIFFCRAGIHASGAGSLSRIVFGGLWTKLCLRAAASDDVGSSSSSA
eukprot:1974567-Pyramimonas_sp.AAC.1